MVKNLGNEVFLYPLVLQEQVVIHSSAQKWLAEGDIYRKNAFFVMKKNLWMFIKRPVRLISTFFTALTGNLSNPKFLLRALYLFPLAVAMSVQMEIDGIEHIHAHYATHPALAAWIIHRLTGIPYSITVHAHDIFVHQTMLREKIKSAGFIRAISSYNKDFLIRKLGSDYSEKIFVIHTGIDPNLYKPRNKKKDGDFLILNIGSLQPYKGQAVLIKACAILKNKGYSFRCVIIGQGELKNSLQEMITRLNLGDRVSLAGAKTEEEIRLLLPDFDCYVQPSVITPNGKMEGIPVAIMEAMACEVPVIATNISGVPELVEDQKTGYLVPAEDSEAIVAAIEKIIQDPRAAEKFIFSGKERINKEFNLRKNVKKLVSLFKVG